MDMTHVQVVDLSPEAALALEMAATSLRMAGLHARLMKAVVHSPGNYDETGDCLRDGHTSSFYFTPDDENGVPIHVQVQMTCTDHTKLDHNWSQREVIFTCGLEDSRYRHWTVTFEQGEDDSAN